MNDVHPFGCLSNVHQYHPSMDEIHSTKRVLGESDYKHMRCTWKIKTKNPTNK
jgi:hypothetical protein